MSGEKEKWFAILQSIDQGPFELGTIRDTLGTTSEDGVLIGPEMASKAIWDNVKMLLAGSELTKEDMESYCMYEFEQDDYANIQLNSKLSTTCHLNGIESLHPLMIRLPFSQVCNPLPKPSQSQSHQYQSSTTPPQSQNVQSIPYSQFAESSSPDSGYTQTEEILNTLSKQFALLTQSFRATLPQTNNQLRTSSNTQNQATIQDGQIVVQNVQGRQNQNQRNFARGNGAAGFGGMQNRAGNANAGQGKPVKCYNCNGVGHIARNCTQPKRPQNSDYFKDKMLLMQAQENDVDNQPVQDLALNEDNIFQADECDAFDSDVDDEPTAQTIFMANLSSAGNSDDIQAASSETRPPMLDRTDNYAFVPHYLIATELKIYKEQVAIYEQCAKFELTEREHRMDDQMHKLENKLHAQDQSIQTVHMMLKPKRLYDQYSELSICAQNPFYLKKAKVAQPALYDGNELINVDHDPIDVPSSEEDLELAELTRQKMYEKLNNPVCVEKRIKCIPPNYSKENFLATFTPQTQLTPEQVFWSLDLAKRKAEELKAKTPPLLVLPPATDVFYTVTDSTLSASRFHDLSTAYNVAINRVVELESENSRLLRKIEHDDHDTMIKAFLKLEVAHVNLQLKQQHLKENANNLKSKSPRDVPEFDVFFELDLQNQLEDFKAENVKIKLHYQELFNSIKVMCAQTTKKAKSLQNEIENLRTQLKGKMPCVASDVKTPKVFAFEKYAIDVEPIPFRLKKNREVHLHYIKRLKENVETLRKIVEDATVERPLDTSLASACCYTKHSQELLEYVIGTCPKDFGPRDKQNAYTNLLRKKQVNFVEPCETSTPDTPPQVEYQKINSTNASRIPSTGVKGALAASGSKPRSNTKKDRTLPARSVLKQVEAHSRMNKSNEKQENHVDSSISSKRCTDRSLVFGLRLLKTYDWRSLTAQEFHEKVYRDFDDYPKFTWVKFLRSKDETPAFIINLLKQLQSDSSKTVRTPQQNGVVERRNRTLVEAARTILIFSKAPLFLWAEAVDTACYTQN
ncbi:retrovirus-related pol polyprotein from transposon TNT 1-94 [Tanacetum coccineum]|uniref:Retrovirus-related pol polyprotein from transposon TNT 1-94 n=1 Tax=Tanacetum coccineum TaxID=301880 RepID=A0ABQ4YLZ7_9ASTR